MDHSSLVKEQPHTLVEETVVIAPAQPVGDDMVRFSRNDDPNVNPARCSLVEGCDNVVIGDEVALGHPDPLTRAIDGLQVHVPDGIDRHPGGNCGVQRKRYPNSGRREWVVRAGCAGG